MMARSRVQMVIKFIKVKYKKNTHKIMNPV